MKHDTDDEQPYSMREMRRLLEAPLRRPWLVAIPLLVCLVLAVAVSLSLAPRYRSSTLILVAPDQMPSEFVSKMNTESIGQRLLTLRQEVQSRTRLEEVARALDPYGMIGREPIIQTIEKMRAAVKVTIKGKDAFSIEFEHTDPKMAMLVADRLTTLFMEDVVGERERQVSQAYQFIESQLEEARQELQVKEEALRDFKQRHMGTLPEQVNSNLATLQRLQLEHQTVAEALAKANETLLLLESGLTVSGTRAPGADGAQMGPAQTLAALRVQLQQFLARYTPEHPDVLALKARIANLEKQVQATAEAAAEAEPDAAPEALDPAQALARAQIIKARNDVERHQQRLAEVEQEIARFQARVEATPQREQEIRTLTRDYQQLGENYAELLSKKLEAEMSAKLEQYSKGQQFRVIDPAYLPERPSFPNHWLFALGGGLCGLLLGTGLTVVVDFLDPTVKDLEDVRDLLPFPVVAVMPYVRPKDARRLAAAHESPNASATRPPDGVKAQKGRRRAVPFRPRLRGGKRR
jgi:polysaccharide chain length determinant protein (PEP-CTERM system associated)